MSRIEWTKELELGIDTLDSQHRELISLYNDLHEALMSQSAENANKIKLATLDKLSKYVGYHFEHEEGFMQKIGYAELERHQRLHLEFAGRIAQLQQDVQDNHMVLSTSLMKFLRNWILDHIAKEDQRFVVK